VTATLCLAVLMAGGWFPDCSINPLDLGRFPPKAAVEANVAFARSYIRCCDHRSVSSAFWWQRDQAWEEGREARRCLAPWETLERARAWAGDCKTGNYGRWAEGHLRKILRNLREELGPEAYHAGQMPAPVPWWRMQRGN
jgi:hypothetical protein